MLLTKGNRWRGEKGKGVGGFSMQLTRVKSGQGNHATTQRRDFQVSRESLPGGEGWDFQAKTGLSERGCRHAPHVYIVLIKDCI
jgi:hypothetical protein